MEVIIKRSRQLYASYKQLKTQQKDASQLSSCNEFRELKNAVDILDIGKTFRFNEEMFSNDNSLGFSKLHEEEGINISVFFVPKYCSMPLHDHPDMHVFSRPLFGKAKTSLFSLIDASDRQRQFTFPLKFWQYYQRSAGKGEQLREVVSAQQSELHLLQAGQESIVVSPKQNNLHEIIAVENFAFLDVLVPDYDLETGKRFCNFYSPTKIIDQQKLIYEMAMSQFPEAHEYDIRETISPLIRHYST